MKGHSGYLNNFVGREFELNELGQLLLNPYGEIRILFILGNGGIGKTTLVNRMLEELKASGFLATREPIDLFCTDYRHIDGIQWKIRDIIEQLTEREGESSPFADWVKGRSDTSEKFYECLKAFCAEHPLVLAFDTFENLDKVTSDWLFKGEPDGLQVPGLICIVAGRDKEIADLETYHKNPLVEEIHVSGFSLEETEEFFWRITDEYKLEKIDPLDDLLKAAGLPMSTSIQNSIDWVWKITDGHPMKLEMVFRWLDTLFEDENLKDLTTDKFEERLMEQVRELAERGQLDTGVVKRVSQPVFDTLICMAYVTRRFDGHILRYLVNKKLIHLDEPNVSEKDILENLEKYFFVKVRSGSGPEPVIQLHDEMARLVRDYVWPFLDNSGERKRALLEAVDQYYDQLIGQQTGEEADILRVERLYYALQRDWQGDGKRLWFELVELGNEDINKLLSGEIKDYIERYDRETQYSIYRAIAEIEREAQHINQSRGYWEKVKKLGEEEKREDWVAHALFGLSSCEDNATKSLELLEKAKTICVEKAPEILPNVYYNMGFTYRRMQDIKKTIYWYREAKDRFQKTPWDKGLDAKIANDLGYAYSFVGEWDECRKNVNAGLRMRKGFLVEIEREVGRVQMELDSTANEGTIGKLRDELSRQKDRRSKALLQLGLSYSTLGQIYRYQDELDEALQNYEQAYELFEEAKNYTWQARTLFSRGETHRRIARVRYEQGNEQEYREQIEKAKKDIEESLYLCDKYHLKDDRDTANRRLGRCLHDLALYSYKHDRSAAMELLDKARLLFIEGAEYARKTNDALEELENIQELAFIADDVMEISGSSELPSEWQGSMDKFEQALEKHRADEFRIYQFPVFENLLEFEKAAINYRSKKYGDALKGYLKAYSGLISDPGYGSARYRQHYSQLTRTIDALPDAEAARWCGEFIRVWENTPAPEKQGRTLAQEDTLGLAVWCKRKLKNIEVRKA
jgi:tetratricopeptide (TPR) repeat protein